MPHLSTPIYTYLPVWEVHGLGLSRPPEAPAASVGVEWTHVAEEVRPGFLRVERTTSLEAESHDVAQGYRHVMRQRLKPWCGLGGQRRVPDRRKWPDREYCLKIVTF